MCLLLLSVRIFWRHFYCSFNQFKKLFLKWPICMAFEDTRKTGCPLIWLNCMLSLVYWFRLVFTVQKVNASPNYETRSMAGQFSHRLWDWNVSKPSIAACVSMTKRLDWDREINWPRYVLYLINGCNGWKLRIVWVILSLLMNNFCHSAADHHSHSTYLRNQPNMVWNYGSLQMLKRGKSRRTGGARIHRRYFSLVCLLLCTNAHAQTFYLSTLF